MNLKETKQTWIPQAIAIPLLLWALNPGNPYGYYIILRVICCACFAYLATYTYSINKTGWTWVFGVIAFIYNPIIRVHSTRTIWSIVNVATAILAFASIFALAPSTERKERQTNEHNPNCN